MSRNNNYPSGGQSGQGFLFLIIGFICALCAWFSYMGIFNFLAAAGAVAFVYLAIARFAGQKLGRWRFLVLAVLLFGFGGLVYYPYGFLFDGCSVISLIVGVVQLFSGHSGHKERIPNGQFTERVNPSRSGSVNIRGKRVSENDIYTVNATESKPETPKQTSNTQPYQEALDKLKADIDELDARQNDVSDFLDDFFAGSTVSKSRYISVIDSAKKNLENNYEKAKGAVKLFGNKQPTKERMDILNRYVEDSRNIIDKVEKVIDELIKVQQNDVISDQSTLGSLLDDLASTTSYYQRSSYSDSDTNNSNSQSTR